MPTYNVSRIGSVENGFASECSMFVMPDGSGVATASRDANGHVEFTLWNLLPDGSIQLYGQNTAGSQAGIRITGVAVGDYITAGMSTAGGHVKSIFWRAAASTGEGSGSQGTQVSVTSFPIRFAMTGPPPTPPQGNQVVYPEGYLVVTAHSNSTHHLRVTGWFAGVKIIQGIDVIASATGGEAMVTSIATKQSYLTNTNLSSADVVVGSISLGKLHLGTWRLVVADTATPSVDRLHSVATNESTKEIATATYPPDPATRLLTALITDQGNLKLILWQLNPDGTFTRLADTTTAGTASEVSCAYVKDSVVVTAFKSSSGRLKLIYWQVPASPSDPLTITRVTEIEGGNLPAYGGVSVGHWRAQSAPANDLGETLVAVRTEAGNLKVIRYRLTIS